MNRLMTAPIAAPWTHGGPDALGAPRFDFSTNTNACGPCPQALAAVQAADVTLYPDPAYTALRQNLAAFHGVDPERVLLAGSASEFIFRITAWARQKGLRTVHLPAQHYGDYARAAQAWGMACVVDETGAAGALTHPGALIWACEPSSPLGQPHTHWPQWLLNGDAESRQSQIDVPDNLHPQNGHPTAGRDFAPGREPGSNLLVLDRAYAALRLSGASSLTAAQLDRVWQLFTPNKALGLTGVRAAYVIAPIPNTERARGQKDLDMASIHLMAPSWPLGADGVTMLQAWVSPEVQSWLAACLPLLREWKLRQIELLTRAGWQVAPSEANYFCAQPPHPVDLSALRQTHGIKLRDATSFGLPGWLRLGVLGPVAQDALAEALHGVAPRNTTLETTT